MSSEKATYRLHYEIKDGRLKSWVEPVVADEEHLAERGIILEGTNIERIFNKEIDLDDPAVQGAREGGETFGCIVARTIFEALCRREQPNGCLVRGPMPGRNDPCPCGSGKKFKKCCLN
jgi:hypothetical protein